MAEATAKPSNPSKTLPQYIAALAGEYFQAFFFRFIFPSLSHLTFDIEFDINRIHLKKKWRKKINK